MRDLKTLIIGDTAEQAKEWMSEPENRHQVSDEIWSPDNVLIAWFSDVKTAPYFEDKFDLILMVAEDFPPDWGNAYAQRLNPGGSLWRRSV